MKAMQKRKFRGLTLMELMIVLVILGVLLLIVLPTYDNAVLKSHRRIAIAELYQVLARQEQYRQENKYYAVQLSDLGLPGVRYGIDVRGNRQAADFQQNIYLLELRSVDDDMWVTAVPQRQQENDTQCGSLSLRSDGRHFNSGSGGLNECW
jgi:type IV pilus assembly protein PilE